MEEIATATPATLARAIKAPMQTIAGILHGRRRLIPTTALLIAKALSTSEIELLDMQRAADLAKAPSA